MVRKDVVAPYKIQLVELQRLGALGMVCSIVYCYLHSNSRMFYVSTRL